MLLNCGVVEDSWESPGLQGDWVFLGRADVEAETPILWPPDAKSWLIWKDPDAGKDWGHKEKGTTEEDMVGWHHWVNGHEFGWTPGVGDGQGGLACCGSWGRQESDTPELLNWTELLLRGSPDSRTCPLGVPSQCLHWSSRSFHNGCTGKVTPQQFTTLFRSVCLPESHLIYV